MRSSRRGRESGKASGDKTENGKIKERRRGPSGPVRARRAGFFAAFMRDKRANQSEMTRRCNPG